MNVSYLIITHNRRGGLLANLQALLANNPNADVWIVDNASTDGTADAVRDTFPSVRLIQLDRNLGMPARNVALKQMTSEFVVLIDDDSYPIGDAVEWSVAHMTEHRDVAAVVGRAVLPDGRSEAPAMPAILLGCATCVRLRALRDVGFFPHDFFRQAEEYDLSIRLWSAGYRVERFEDVCYRHNKKPSASRASADVAAFDLKHNLILAARFLPEPARHAYWSDFAWRYSAILAAATSGAEADHVFANAVHIVSDAELLRIEPMNAASFEAVFEHRRQLRLVSQFTEKHAVRRVAIADVSKNLFATYQACQRAGLRVTAIIDDRREFAGKMYRNVPVVAGRDLVVPAVDGVVLSNTNPARVDAAYRVLLNAIDRPILRLWSPRFINAGVERSRVAA